MDRRSVLRFPLLTALLSPLAARTQTTKPVPGESCKPTPAAERKSATAIMRLSMQIGDGKSKTITINHGMGTRNVLVVLHGRQGQEYWCAVEVVSSDAVKLHFNKPPALNEYQAVLIF